jgi:hypothetical protein
LADIETYVSSSAFQIAGLKDIDMRKALFAAIWILVVLATQGGAQSGGKDSAKENVRARLVGSWRLSWVEEQAPDGKMVKSEPSGIIMYTLDGHVAVQIMLSDTSKRSVSNPVQYEQGGYEGYFGTYEIDEAAHTVTHHVEGALVRSLIGKDLTRVYRLEGKQLVLKSARPDEHWTIAWEHN